MYAGVPIHENGGMYLGRSIVSYQNAWWFSLFVLFFTYWFYKPALLSVLYWTILGAETWLAETIILKGNVV